MQPRSGVVRKLRALFSAAPATRDMSSLPTTSYPGIEMPLGVDSVPPHCDPSILHAPGVCDYCDVNPGWQVLREVWRINYTGQYDPDKAPCPSVHFRTDAVRDRWPGNRPEGWEPQ